MHTEYTTNIAFQSQAAERARWAAVLAKPASTQRKNPRMVRRVSVLARIIALFA